jgi:hypothetical protein
MRALQTKQTEEGQRVARKFEERKAKPSNDAYTGMLIVSFVALLIGCALLYVDYSQYGDKAPTKLTRDAREVGPRPSPEGEPKKAQQPPPDEANKDQPGEPKDKEKEKDKDKDKDMPPDKQ